MTQEVIAHKIQREIILKLIHAPKMTFNQLWAKQGESNTFAYHVNKLEADGYITKTESGEYSLAPEGRKLSAFIEGDTGASAQFPTLTVLIIVRNGNKFLCQKRLKEPFYGLWGFISGKINFGFNLFECASRDLLEETGLVAKDWQFKGIELIKSFENEKLAFHHYMLVVETSNSTGTLKEKTHKSENAWLTLEEYEKMERFPSNAVLEHILPSEHPVIVELERFVENGKVKASKIVSVNQC